MFSTLPTKQDTSSSVIYTDTNELYDKEILNLCHDVLNQIFDFYENEKEISVNLICKANNLMLTGGILFIGFVLIIYTIYFYLII